MQLGITFDDSHFIVQLNGDCVRSGIVTSANSGDVVRISTNYERNFFVNSSPIGMFDKDDDAMYQNVFTLIPDSDQLQGKLDVGFPKTDSLGDALPYSVADAHITAPVGWHFFRAPAYPLRVGAAHFRELEKVYSLGLFVASLKLPQYRFKILQRLDDFRGIKNACGVAKEGDDYLWVFHEDAADPTMTFLEDEGGVLTHIKTVPYGSVDALIDAVTMQLLREKKGG